MFTKVKNRRLFLYSIIILYNSIDFLLMNISYIFDLIKTDRQYKSICRDFHSFWKDYKFCLNLISNWIRFMTTTIFSVKFEFGLLQLLSFDIHYSSKFFFSTEVQYFLLITQINKIFLL